MNTGLLGTLKRQAIVVALAAGVVGPALVGLGAQSAHACDFGDLLAVGCDRPGTPQNVAVTVTENSASLRWDLVTGNFGFLTANIRVSENGKDKPLRSTAVFDRDGSGHAGVADLSYGTNFCFSVQLKGENNLVSDYSDWACAKTGFPPLSNPNTPAPTAPTGINPTNIHLVASGAAYVEIGWDYTASTPSYFSIYRDGKPAGTVQPFSTQSYLYTDVFTAASDHAYSYKVCAVFSRGDLGAIEDCGEAQVTTSYHLVLSNAVQANNTCYVCLLQPIVTPTPTPPPGH